MLESSISRIRVHGLFGLYDYSLPKEGVFQQATILYGDNGAGKSTLLRLVFHLLSPAPNRFHRTALHSCKFSRLDIQLSSGVSVSATRSTDESTPRIYLAVARGRILLALWECYPTDTPESSQYMWIEVTESATGKRRVLRKNRNLDYSALQQYFDNAESAPNGERVFLDLLERLAPRIFFLDAQRHLISDTMKDPDLARSPSSRADRRARLLVTEDAIDRPLQDAMLAAFTWLREQAIKATNEGTTNVHSVYAAVIRRILNRPDGGPDSASPAELQARLQYIGRRTEEFSRYELDTPLDVSDLIRSFSSLNESHAGLIVDIIAPYVASIDSRLRALEPVYEAIDRLIGSVNELFHDKRILFTLTRGFAIVNNREESVPIEALSSGEKQLLVLFCAVLVSQDSTRTFLIDEPEISLNIKWQRKLLESLLALTGSASTQFMIATHSLELLSQHMDRVVPLRQEG